LWYNGKRLEQTPVVKKGERMEIDDAVAQVRRIGQHQTNCCTTPQEVAGPDSAGGGRVALFNRRDDVVDDASNANIDGDSAHAATLAAFPGRAHRLSASLRRPC
jgi:hypothetical protein